MCDMFLEMIKTMSMSEAEMRKRFQITNTAYIQELEQRKNIMFMASHTQVGNGVSLFKKTFNLKPSEFIKKFKTRILIN